jgi:16S rRNA (cytidine1402-2'-O)-methyltransferase
LPEKAGRRQSFLQKLKTLPMTLVFYESPRRIIDSLKDIRDILGDRDVAVTRELTKVFEEVIRGRVDELVAKLEEQGVKGEITLLVGGAPEKPEAGDGEIETLFREMEQQGDFSTRDFAARIAGELNLPRKRVYEVVLKLRSMKQE